MATKTFAEMIAEYPLGVPATKENSILLGVSESDIERMNADYLSEKSAADVGNDLAGKIGCSESGSELAGALLDRAPPCNTAELAAKLSKLADKVEALEKIQRSAQPTQIIHECTSACGVAKEVAEKLIYTITKVSSLESAVNTLAAKQGLIVDACANMAEHVDPAASPDPNYREDFLNDVG